MKKLIITLFGLLGLGVVLSAQQPANETFTGRLNNIPGVETSAPITFKVNNTTGSFSFESPGNGHHIGKIVFSGSVPTGRLQMRMGGGVGLSAPGSPWGFELQYWSNITIAEKDGKNVKETTLVAVPHSNTNRAMVSGQVSSDGKSVQLTIRVPYKMDVKGETVTAQIPFTCTLNIPSGRTGQSSQSGRTQDPAYKEVPMPTGTTSVSGIDLDNVKIGGGGGSQPANVQARRVSVGKVAFALAPGYKAKARENLGGGQSVEIQSDANPNDRLYLEVQTEGLSNVRNLSSNQVGDLLNVRVEYLNTVMPGIRFDSEPKIYYDNNSDGYYHPHCYAYGKGKDASGRAVRTYTEATLVNKNTITAGFAVAADEGEFNALTDIYVDAVNAAAGK